MVSADLFDRHDTLNCHVQIVESLVAKAAQSICSLGRLVRHDSIVEASGAIHHVSRIVSALLGFSFFGADTWMLDMDNAR